MREEQHGDENDESAEKVSGGKLPGKNSDAGAEFDWHVMPPSGAKQIWAELAYLLGVV